MWSSSSANSGSASQFGNGNVLVISPYLAQIMEPSTLREIGLDPAAFEVIAIKSRVHFRRGFDDSGFAKTILLVEPTEPFLGTVRLDALALRECRSGALLIRSATRGFRVCPQDNRLDRVGVRWTDYLSYTPLTR